eukprot:2246196-Rhodomonas_salina.2
MTVRCSALLGFLVLCLAQSAFGTDLQHHSEAGKWELCGPQREIGFSSFTTTLEGTMEDGYMILEVEGTLLKPIYNGSYEFKVTHVRVKLPNPLAPAPAPAPAPANAPLHLFGSPKLSFVHSSRFSASDIPGYAFSAGGRRDWLQRAV